MGPSVRNHAGEIMRTTGTRLAAMHIRLCEIASALQARRALRLGPGSRCHASCLTRNAIEESEVELMTITWKQLPAILATACALVAPAAAATAPPDGPQLPNDLGQVQPQETILQGEVQSVDESGTEITLTDGTTLVTPPGATLRPGALEQGNIVIATYREENGNNVLTGLLVRDNERVPAASDR